MSSFHVDYDETITLVRFGWDYLSRAASVGEGRRFRRCVYGAFGAAEEITVLYRGRIPTGITSALVDSVNQARTLMWVDEDGALDVILRFRAAYASASELSGR